MFVLVDKPTGISSFGVIKVLKKFYPGQKIGHSGTLDPMATGLMILAIGKDTKNLTSLIGLDKSYVVSVDFSKISDTWDMEYRNELKDYPLWVKNSKVLGITLDGKPIKKPELKQIEDKLRSLIPKYNLPIPAFSAKKKDGKRLYHLARRGIQDLQYKDMKVDGFEILHYDFPVLQLSLDVGSGTYVRSIAYRLGQQFDLGGILVGLRRIVIGKWNINDFEMKSIENSQIKYCELESLQ